jgi:hypothetical protein
MLFASFNVIGQAKDSLTTIIFKDGRTLKGKELDIETPGKISLSTRDHVISFSEEDVAYIKKERGTNKFSEKRLINRTSLSFLNGSIENGYGVQHTLYYKANKYINTGVGFGINNYLTQSGYNLFPLFFDMSIKLRDSRITPYLSLVVGYSFAQEDSDLGQIEANGGRLFAPRLGYGIEMNDVFLDIYCGLRFQSANYVYRIWEGEGTDVFNYKRLELGLGISF